MATMNLAAFFTGATLDATNLTIPRTALPTLVAANTDANGEEIAFSLVDAISDKIIAFNTAGATAADRLAYTVSTATEAAQGVDLVRKGYTFTFVMAHPFDENTADVSVSP